MRETVEKARSSFSVHYPDSHVFMNINVANMAETNFCHDGKNGIKMNMTEEQKRGKSELSRMNRAWFKLVCACQSDIPV